MKKKQIFNELGVPEAADADPKAVKAAMAKVVGLKEDSPCNLVWKKVKPWLEDEKKKVKLAKRLQKSL